jgi:hypothetical protein
MAFDMWFGLHYPQCQNRVTLGALKAVLWIHIGFNADPDLKPALYLKADPDLDPKIQTNANPDPGQTVPSL